MNVILDQSINQYVILAATPLEAVRGTCNDGFGAFISVSKRKNVIFFFIWGGGYIAFFNMLLAVFFCVKKKNCVFFGGGGGATLLPRTYEKLHSS